MSGLVILLILGSTFEYFCKFLLEDATVAGVVVDLVFYCLARNVFNLLALVLKIEAFLARTLRMVVLTAFLPIVCKCIFLIAVIGAVLVLEFISLLFLTLLGVALHLYFDTFGLHLGCLLLLSSIFDWTSGLDFMVK